MTYIPKHSCFECGKPTQEMHHPIPQSMGGTKVIPLCVECHDKVHDGLGRRRDQHAVLTSQGLAKRRPFHYFSIWYLHIKNEDMSIADLAEGLEVTEASIKKSIKALEKYSPSFMKELFLPYIGYEYVDVSNSFWSCDEFSLDYDDLNSIITNRDKLTKNLLKELDMTYGMPDNPMKEIFGEHYEHYESYRNNSCQ